MRKLYTSLDSIWEMRAFITIIGPAIPTLPNPFHHTSAQTFPIALTRLNLELDD